jgi:hypothetical protein
MKQVFVKIMQFETGKLLAIAALNQQIAETTL